MTAKETLAAMSKGEILCMGFDGLNKSYWLEPSRRMVRSDVAERIIALPGIVPGGDRLFKDSAPQTWRMARAA